MIQSPSAKVALMFEDTTTLSARSIASKPSAARSSALPTLMTTWTIEQTFGGMTAMCLKRANVFHANGIPTAVVTFAPDEQFELTHKSLTESGRLDVEVPIINLHNYYDQHLPNQVGADFVATELPDLDWGSPSTVLRTSDQTLFYRAFSAGKGSALKRREYYRRDGTVYLLDCTLPSSTSKTKTKRILQLFRRGRSPVAEFTSASKLYRHWLSTLIGDTESNVIVDSKYAAGFLNSWEHPGAIKIFNFHSTHLMPQQDVIQGKLSPAHLPVIENRTKWDGLVFLTDSQRSAFNRRFNDIGNSYVMGNPTEGPSELPSRLDRDLSKVVYVGRLTAAKNIDEVIEIVHSVARSGQPISLDIIGEGSQRSSLEELVRTLGLEDKVRFLGQVESIGEHLRKANVLLLCSSFEGQSLALMEAQAHGCVPVAYDVDFGPRDVIDHSATGYLVPYQDQTAAVGTIIRLFSNDELASKISGNAFNKAKDYNEVAIFQRWQHSLEIIRKNRSKLSKLSQIRPILVGLGFIADGSIRVDIELVQKLLTIDSLELLVSPRSESESTNTISVSPHSSEVESASFIVPSEIYESAGSKGTLDLHLKMYSGTAAVSVRLGVQNQQSLSPYLTAYGNLSLK